MHHAGLVGLIVVTGCRIGFDPIESGPDAGIELSTSSSSMQTAKPDTIFTHRCEPDSVCEVDCRLAATCVVECNGAAVCDVSCPATGCYVTDCSPLRDTTCDVECGDNNKPSHYGTTATCP